VINGVRPDTEEGGFDEFGAEETHEGASVAPANFRRRKVFFDSRKVRLSPFKTPGWPSTICRAV
jgi:hypothetical protein